MVQAVYQAGDIDVTMAQRQAAEAQESFVQFTSIRNQSGVADTSWAFGTRALRPSSAALGDRYYANDVGTRGGWLYYWIGAAWEIVVGWASGTDAIRAAIAVSSVDNGAWFYTTDTTKFWEVSAGVWTDRTPTGAVGANPTASVGLSAVNGSAATFLRSDGAPALDQAIAPTWSGAHTFTNSAGVVVSNTAPKMVLTDTTASAKSLTIAVDANIADLRESAGASGSLMVLDLANNRVGIGTASPNTSLEVNKSSATSNMIRINNPDTAGTKGLEIYESATLMFHLLALGSADGGVHLGGNNAVQIWGNQNGPMLFGVNAAERARITAVGNLKLAGTATRATTEGTNHLDIFNGTAPVGTLTNGISLYSTAGELRCMDAAGNATLLSPHDDEGNWIHDEINHKGRRLRVDMERLVKAVDALLGGGYVIETDD